MSNLQKKLIEILIQRGNELLKQPYRKIEFTKDPEADDLLNNLKQFPHAFALACVTDRQVKAERAWRIPYEISKEIDGFSFSKLLKLDSEQFRDLFRRKKLHRFNDVMAENFYLAVQKIHNEYDDDASNIWKDNPRSATIVRRFLEFKGVGVKIATMAANILARDFKIPIKDYICIEVSPDRHVKRVFKRLGFIPKDASNDEIIYCARELNPQYPGIFDLPCWEIGRNWCNPTDPTCNECYLREYCPKKI
ncbi:MAG: iron-sulfur cluster loop [Candidatus Bathyarchaeia archaeon]